MEQTRQFDPEWISALVALALLIGQGAVISYVVWQLRRVARMHGTTLHLHAHWLQHIYIHLGMLWRDSRDTELQAPPSLRDETTQI